MHAIVACGSHRSSALKHKRRRTFSFTTNMARPGFRTDFSRHRSLSAVRNVVARRITARSNIQPTKSAQGLRAFLEASHTHNGPTNVPAEGHGRAIVRPTAESLPFMASKRLESKRFRADIRVPGWQRLRLARTGLFTVSGRAERYSFDASAQTIRRRRSRSTRVLAEFAKVSSDQQPLEIFRDRRFEQQAFARDGMDERRPPRV